MLDGYKKCHFWRYYSLIVLGIQMVFVWEERCQVEIGISAKVEEVIREAGTFSLWGIRLKCCKPREKQLSPSASHWTMILDSWVSKCSSGYVVLVRKPSGGVIDCTFYCFSRHYFVGWLFTEDWFSTHRD